MLFLKLMFIMSGRLNTSGAEGDASDRLYEGTEGDDMSARFMLYSWSVGCDRYDFWGRAGAEGAGGKALT